MAYVLGKRGQVVIDKKIRERLGIKPGSVAVERLVEDHVEIYFIPPAHKRSLKGSLSAHVSTRVAPGEAWDRARQAAWDVAAEYQEGKINDSESTGRY